MNTTRWISDKISKLLPHASAKSGSNGYSTGNSQGKRPVALVIAEQHAIKVVVIDAAAKALKDAAKASLVASAPGAARSIRDRLKGSLRHNEEALSPRRRLLQRFSAFPEGIRFLVDLRADMLPQIKADKRLQALDVKMLDPVARFHLGNGARVERLNWAGDPSVKDLKQSCGLMVNYQYDLKRLDKHRALLAQGKIAVSAEIEWLAF